MIERFDKRILTGKIKLTLKDPATNEKTVWEADKAHLVANIKSIVTDYAKQGYTLTLRQLYYQLVSANIIRNHDTIYHKLSAILDDCRYSGAIDWNAIEDRGRVPYLPYYLDGVEDALRDAVDTYRIDRQQGQLTHVELWTEKDAISGILKRVTTEYHIRLVVNKGYTSSTAIYGAYERFVKCLNSGQAVQILYFGDHDPSGLDMIRDIRERLEFMFQNGAQIEDDNTIQSFNVQHIGLTKAQINKYNPPPNPAKITDPRAVGYIKKHGQISYEVDALKPEVLVQIVHTAVKSHIDLDMFNAALAREAVDQAKIQRLIKSVK